MARLGSIAAVPAMIAVLAAASLAPPAQAGSAQPPAAATMPPPSPNTLSAAEKAEGFVLLFNGKTLDGWTPQDKERFRVEGGKLICDGVKRSMLFYSGPVANHHFTNFDFRCQVYSHPKGNSGVYIHTKAIEKGFPDAYGYECQVYNAPGKERKTGSLYKVVDVYNSPVKDDEWFDYSIRVQGRHIVIKVNGTTTVDYTEPQDKIRLNGGTFGLQCHDPGAVEFRSIRVRILP